MNKASVVASTLLLAAHSLLAGGDLTVKKIVLNGKSQAASIATKKMENTIYLEAASLAQTLRFTLKRQNRLAILCTEQACLPFAIGGEETLEQDGRLFVSAPAVFNDVGGEWELDEKNNTLNVDLPEGMPTNNAPVDVIVGSTAPGFLVTAADGKEIRLTDFRGKKNVVLEFFRSGGW